MAYIIEGFVENLSSDGAFFIKGTEGYCLEKEDNAYNVFWKNPENDSGKSGDAESDAENAGVIPQKDFWLKIIPDGRQWEFQLLASAKANHQKVRVEVNADSIHNLKSATVTKVTLL